MARQRLRPDEELASFVTSARINDVPADGARAIERAFVDTVGVTIPGVDEPAARAVKAVFADGDTGAASILGSDGSASVADAALINATAGHALDYDDVTAGIWHPSVTLVAPILAVAERDGASGTDLVTAFAVGFEAQHYVGDLVLPSHYERGWHATSTLGSFGATAAVASLLGLNLEKTRNALNCAASLASGIKKNFGTMTKPLHAGHAARNGVVAASLAAEGFTAAAGALGEDGFSDLYGGDEPESYDEPRSPGNPWAIVEEGLDVKKYPCCYFTHSPIAATQQLVSEHDLDPEDIEKIIVRGSRGALETLLYEDPTTGLEGKFSMEYTVASAVVRDRVGLKTFRDDAIDDAEVQAVRERTQVELDPDLAYQPYTATVELQTSDGQTLAHVQDRPPGTAEQPLSDGELREKFTSGVDNALANLDANAAYEALDNLTSIDDATALVHKLVKSND